MKLGWRKGVIFLKNKIAGAMSCPDRQVLNLGTDIK